MSAFDERWVVSEYMDDGRVGIVSANTGYILLGVSIGLSREIATKICDYHNERVFADERP